MQVWDQVKVTKGEYAGEAGVVQAFNAKEEISTVKLDSQPGTIAFSDADLQFLGR